MDIFLCCPPSEGETRLKGVFDVVMNNQKRRLGPDSRLLVLRSNAAITIFRIASGGFAAPPVQVVLCTCTSVQELLLRFDVDSSCFAFILDEEKVVCTPRGRRALRYGVNIVDNEFFDSSAYTRRLERYAKRGFAIGVPGYLPELVSTRLLSAEYAHFKAYDLLLRLKPLSQCAEELSIPNRNQTAHVKIGGKQDATSVRGFERIVVLDRCTIRHLEVPKLTQRCWPRWTRLRSWRSAATTPNTPQRRNRKYLTPRWSS